MRTKFNKNDTFSFQVTRSCAVPHGIYEIMNIWFCEESILLRRVHFRGGAKILIVFFYLLISGKITTLYQMRNFLKIILLKPVLES